MVIFKIIFPKPIQTILCKWYNKRKSSCWKFRRE